jgi:hypothetical protein
VQRTVPFDYVFDFTLKGRPNTTLNSTITISVEAPFVAVAIGYGIVGPIGQGLTFGVKTRPRRLARLPLASVLRELRRSLDARGGGADPFPAIVRNGLRINPRFASLVLQAPATGPGAEFAPGMLDDLFEVVEPPKAAAQFLYGLFDEGSARAFQSDLVLSTAGLGSPDGRRPFRRLAVPITFSPRSSVRMQVVEKSHFAGSLHVSLHGYKVLGGNGALTDARRARRARR